MKLKDLQPNQVIHIRTKKEAKGIRKLAKKEDIRYYRNKLSEMEFPYGLDYDADEKYLDWGFLDFYKDRESTILPASQFLKKTTKERVKVLEMQVAELMDKPVYTIDAFKTIKFEGEEIPVEYKGNGRYEAKQPKDLTELPETPKEIDFSMPGQIISLEHGLIVLTTGVCDIQTFEGISVINNEFYYVGEKQNWYIKTAKPYTGEPIILK